MLFSKTIFAWLDCPFGKINDPYPGSCFRYVDTNNNKICDHSEPAPAAQSPGKPATSQPATSKPINSFFFWLLFLTLSFYFLHWYLVYKTSLNKKFKWLNQLSFRFFWNVILLISFLITGVSGLVLFFGVVNKTLVSWHNYSGLIFVIVGFFHLLNHLAYFKNILKWVTK